MGWDIWANTPKDFDSLGFFELSEAADVVHISLLRNKQYCILGPKGFRDCGPYHIFINSLVCQLQNASSRMIVDY